VSRPWKKTRPEEDDEMKTSKGGIFDELRAELEAWEKKHATAATAVVRRADWAGRVTDGRAEWTNALGNFLAEAGARRNLNVQPRRLYFSRDQRGQGHNAKKDRPARTDDAGEFLCDLVWYRYGADENWWRAPASEPLQLDLAVEAEWGALGRLDVDNEYHEFVVAEDFCKLLHVDAKARLFLTDTDDAHRSSFCTMLSVLRRRSGLRRGSICVWIWDREASWRQIGRPAVFYP
jgi:hypothetical protein